MSRRARSHSGLWPVFRWPLLLAAASIIGLVAALVGNGAWDVLSWTCLGSLPALVLYLIARH